MKLAIENVRYILVEPLSSKLDAALYIQKMYNFAYGPRAGRVDLMHLTPNEERVIETLVERFSGIHVTVESSWHSPTTTIKWTGNRFPFVVHCGDGTFVFLTVEPYEGFYWPFDMRV